METRPKSPGASPSAAPLQPADLQQFLTEMREAHPHQLMDVVAESSLTRGIVQATLATIVLLALCTVGPYAWDQVMPHETTDSAAAKPAAAATTVPATPPAEESQAAAKPAPEAAPAAARPAPRSESTTSRGEPPVSQKALKKLGVDEVKDSDPGVNPLDSKMDDLLDKIK